jgi:hypothetical protein
VFKTLKNRVGINRRPTPTSADKKMIFALFGKPGNSTNQYIKPIQPFLCPYPREPAFVCGKTGFLVHKLNWSQTHTEIHRRKIFDFTKELLEVVRGCLCASVAKYRLSF